MGKVSGRARAALLAGTLAASTAAFVGAAQPASATPNECNDPAFNVYWHSDQDMADASAPWCRNWVLDPGISAFNTRENILANADMYAPYGFSKQYIEYAPELDLGVSGSSGWSACDVEHGTGPCPAGHIKLENSGAIAHDFGGSVALRSLAWNGSFIALACGNFSVPTAAGDAPVPTIQGFKFNDANHDGVQDDGETGLGDVKFDVVRTWSWYGDEEVGPVGSATSDPSGHFTFRLDGLGPGTYSVQEVARPGWVSTTPQVQQVTIPPGAGDNHYDVTFGNRVETPPKAILGPPSSVDQSSDAGAAVVLDGSASYDPDGDPLTYTWTADGQTQTGANPYPTFVLPPGVWPVQLVVNDGMEDSQPATTTVTVYPNITVHGQDVSAQEGNAFSGTVGTFTDPDPGATADEYQATVNWGDGTSSPAASISKGPDGTFTVTAGHTYAEEGQDAATVTVTDADNAYNTATGPFTATVTDAPLQAAGATVLSTNPVDQVVATFTDQNPGAPSKDFTATIDWGDGSPATTGVVNGSTGGPFSVSGSHTYDTLGYKTAHIHIVDDGGSTADATTSILVYQASGFVIGDLDSAVGTHVTYWGAQWWKANQLSGGTAPAAFKGYANDPAAATSLSAWTTDPGNSSHPPASVPTFMSIIVSSSVGESGSTISGDAPHIVIVQTDQGYAAAPGHTGTGTVVATLR